MNELLNKLPRLVCLFLLAVSMVMLFFSIAYRPESKDMSLMCFGAFKSLTAGDGPIVLLFAAEMMKTTAMRLAELKYKDKR